MLEPDEFGADAADRDAFVAAIRAVKAHNEQFSQAGDIVAMFEALGERSVAIAELTKQGATGEEAAQLVDSERARNMSQRDEAEMQKDFLSHEHFETLARAGLAFIDLRDHTDIPEFFFEPDRSSALRLALLVPADFVAFLNRCDKDAVTEDFADGVRMITAYMRRELAWLVSRPIASHPALVAYANGVASAVHQLGIEDPALPALREIGKQAKEGDVVAYVMASNLGLLYPLDDVRCSPVRWQIDTNTRTLTQRWGEVQQAIEHARDHGSVAQARDYLDRAVAAVAVAKFDWEHTPEERRVFCDPHNDFPTIFSTVQLRLLRLHVDLPPATDQGRSAEPL